MPSSETKWEMPFFLFHFTQIAEIGHIICKYFIVYKSERFHLT